MPRPNYVRGLLELTMLLLIVLAVVWHATELPY